MAEIISIANQKGGVGKTTTAINLAAALACLGQEVLVVDLDPQGNATSGLGFDKTADTPGVYHTIIDSIPAEKTIKASSVELLDVLCSSPEMVSAEIELINTVSRENKVKTALEPLGSMYSFILIDCPPSLGLMTINALAASNRVIVPVQGEYYALEGLATFIETVKRVQETLNPGLVMEGGVLTMFDPRYSLAQQVRAELGKFFNDSMFNTAIPRSVRLAEAPSFGKSILQYDPRSKGSEAYLALAGEVLTRRGWKGMRFN
jgi:chromosome partitioning protein